MADLVITRSETTSLRLADFSLGKSQFEKDYTWYRSQYKLCYSTESNFSMMQIFDNTGQQ